MISLARPSSRCPVAERLRVGDKVLLSIVMAAKRVLTILALALIGCSGSAVPTALPIVQSATLASTHSVAQFSVYLPIAAHSATLHGCPPIPGETYFALPTDPPGPHMPAEVHPDLNLTVRGYEPASVAPQLVDYGGTHDPAAPQFHDLFAQRRLPAFVNSYRVYSWDWEAMRRGPLLTTWPATALGLRTIPGEILHVPDSGYTIGSGAEVLILYAAADGITLKYTRDDNIVRGYTLHVQGVCVEPRLLALYQQCNQQGRDVLPALQPRQAFGRAIGREIVLAIRDSGSLLDPRSRLDWWRSY